MKMLIALLASLAVLGGPSAQAKNVDGALAFLPADISTLIVVDLEATRQTSFFQGLQSQVIDLTGYTRELKQFKREAGFDIMTNVKTVVYAGPEDMIKKAKQSMLVLEGTFDIAKLKAYYAKKSKSPIVEKTGPLGTYFEIAHGKTAFGVFGDFAVYGTKDLFEKAIAAKKAGGGQTKLGALLGRMKAGRDGFGVIAGSSTLKKFLGKSFAGVKDVRTAGLTFDFTGGCNIKIVGSFGDGGAASTAAEAIKKEIGKLAADPEFKEAGLGTALGKVQATASGSEVTVSLALDPAASKEFSGHLKDLFE